MFYVSSNGLLPKVSDDDDQLVAVGGILNNKILIDAYTKGLFPWFNSDEQPICWYSLNPRLLLNLSDVYISSSMKKMLKQNRYKVVLDRDFRSMITLCSSVKREDQNGTWITKRMIDAYVDLHNDGYAHSVEVYNANDKLVGGFYGVSIGSMFCGESMVSLEPNISKYALIHFSSYFKDKGLSFIDCQQSTSHMMSMGGVALDRKIFLDRLSLAIKHETWRGNWQNIFTDFSEYTPLS